jgi:hypothetical protein
MPIIYMSVSVKSWLIKSFLIVWHFLFYFSVDDLWSYTRKIWMIYFMIVAIIIVIYFEEKAKKETFY